MLTVACGVLAVTSRAQANLPPATKHGFVTTADNVRIHYLEAGPGAGRRPSRRGRFRGARPEPNGRPSLLFVPGWMTPAWIWEHQVAHFARDYRVVAMDPRSQGKSSKPAEGHHPAARARAIKALGAHLPLAPGGIVTVTTGVTEVVSYVDQFGTETLAGMVLVNGIAGRDYDEATTRSLLQYANAFQLDRRKAAERFARGLYKKPQSEGYLKRMTEATLLMPTNSAVALFLGSFASDNRAALAKIDKPTLIVVALVRLWMPFYEELQQRIRGSRMEVFDDAGHALFVDEAKRFNTLLDDYLRTLR